MTSRTVGVRVVPVNTGGIVIRGGAGKSVVKELGFRLKSAADATDNTGLRIAAARTAAKSRMRGGRGAKAIFSSIDFDEITKEPKPI